MLSHANVQKMDRAADPSDPTCGGIVKLRLDKAFERAGLSGVRSMKGSARS